MPETRTFKLLEHYGVAYTNVDEPLLPPEMHLTADFAYFRWHGHGDHIWFDYRYSKDELEPWVPRIEAAAAKVKKVYGYFNNHYHGYAPENCLQLMERLGCFRRNKRRQKKRAELSSRSWAHFSVNNLRYDLEIACS